jgi:hypothetical protein
LISVQRQRRRARNDVDAHRGDGKRFIEAVTSPLLEIAPVLVRFDNRGQIISLEGFFKKKQP